MFDDGYANGRGRGEGGAALNRSGPPDALARDREKGESNMTRRGTKLLLLAGLLLALGTMPSLAGQPQSGQPGNTEGQPGGGGNPGDNNQNQPGNQGG